ncbi:S8 family serine peptidase, partial [Flavobacteriaceae bacterium]|nr:S8 family serine peptidase [Flavobacteriaceae bacterium]
MKNLFTLIVLVNQLSWGQMPPAVQQDLMNFEPGELIVKLKDNVDAGVSYAENGKAMSSFNIGELLGIEDKIESSSVMFHQKAIEASVLNSQKMKAVYLSKGMTNPKDPLTMKNIFVLKTLNQQENILMLIEDIKNNPNVEYAEPNYIYSIDDFEVGETIYDETTDNDNEQESSETSDATIDVDDPLYSSQTNITSTNIDDVWEQYTTGDGSQVIAILDTGGDYTHPDLEANTWINTEELNGVEGYDDDGNGYIDDIRGWDFINLDNAPLDDNMHGTHVAGIAGAVGNNGIGIAGAAWDVKLMHIKVFQSTGQGNSTTIAEGVEYANSNGATIINMSFGSYAMSSTLRLVLETSYNSSFLVAAAGNDGIGLDPCIFCAPFYPAAFNFVLGIEDRPRPFAGYTNLDQSGPIMTPYPTSLLNYELAAPGTGIMSTVPNGGYATLTGTSMATPLVAGAMALYNQIKPEDSKELIFGNLINTSPNPASTEPGFVNFLAAFVVEPTPKISIITTIQRDTINDQNGNGFWEPGETIEILPLIKNYWGPTEDVRVGIAFAEFEDTSKATIVQDEIQIGSISAYATLQDLFETLKITISEEVVNNVDIKFVLTAWSGPDQEYMSDPVEFIINVKNSILFYGFINTDLTLTPDKEYLVSDNVVFDNCIITILPGTILKISDGKKILLNNNAELIAIGNNNEFISFEAENVYWGGFEFLGKFTFDYVKVTGFNGYFHWDNSLSTISNSIFYDNRFSLNPYEQPALIKGKNITTSNFFYNDMRDGALIHLWNNSTTEIDGDGLSGYFIDNNVIGNVTTLLRDNNTAGISFRSGSHNIETEPTLEVMTGNVFGNLNTGSYDIENDIGRIDVKSNFTDTNVQLFPPMYYGSTNEETIRLGVRDYFNEHPNQTSPLAPANLDLKKDIPSANAHGIVWKIEVNGKDAQDEYELMDPIGIGEHEFKVYFNRAMDTSINPLIFYGVINPFTQTLINEEGTWSGDGKIYTVIHDIRVGAADGINRIRVQGARDLDNFEIPVENYRFNMLVQSAGSASAGWYATPGLGKIALTWEAPSAEEIDDALGYNMYRYQVDADGVESTPVKLNESLIVEDTDESTTGVYYSDFDVVQGETYFYKYNILRTSFETTDYSSVVSTTPLTSTLGDSNGDFTVDVLDLVHDVDYILGNNPTPFIFLAGDVNADNAINVLDIVGTVDIILNPSDATDSSIGSSDIQFYPSNSIGNAVFTWEGNDLYVEADHNIGGLQLAFSNDFEYTVSSELATIEKLDYIQDDTKVVMLFSFNNTVIADGKTKLLTRLDESKDLNIELAVVGTTSGSKLTAIFEDTNLEDIESPLQSDSLEFLSMIP